MCSHAALLDLQCGEIDHDALEPGRPDGLGRLSPTLDSFVDIMGIDRGLIAAAAEGASRASAAPTANEADLQGTSVAPDWPDPGGGSQQAPR